MELIVREGEEDDETFQLRKKYTLLLLDNLTHVEKFLPINLTPELTDLLGRMIIKKVRYGVSYDPKYEDILNQINFSLMQKEKRKVN